MSVKIYTMTHKKFYEPEDNKLYIPLHVGRAMGSNLGYLGDNTGENISEKNPYYGELTGVYWVWKNDKDSDYIGICHYRRFFVDKVHRQLLKAEDYEGILKEYDVIVSTAMAAEGSYEEYYGEAHNAEDLKAVGRAVEKIFPLDYPVFDAVVHQPFYYYGNLMVTDRDRFMEYASWLFAILEEAAKEIDVSGYDMYNQRVFGFLSEQLLRVWITARGLKAYECPIGITAEKAETVELKLALGQLIKQSSISEAKELFYEFIKLRPDVQLELSDIKGELPIIEQLIYVMEQEQNNDIKGILDYSNQLPELIDHYKKLREILKDSPRKSMDSCYLEKTKVSYFLIMVMLLNNPFSEEEKKNSIIMIREYFKSRNRLTEANALEGMLST